jgi:deoxyribose-phosphate aldolase
VDVILDRTAIAAMIDHTLLAPEATPERVAALCSEATHLGVQAVCVSSRWISVAAADLRGRPVAVAGVIGFPSGAHRSELKADEATLAVEDGADELDMVVALGDVLGGAWDRVAADIAGVRDAAPAPVVLKVIIESAVLDLDQLDRVCRIAVDSGADFVKTSTGFHPSGGASVEAVARMRRVVGSEVGVKASGGIRDAAAARRMVEAGASRLGTSSTAAILDGLA